MELYQKERSNTRRFFNRVSFVFPIIEKNLFPEYQKTLVDFNLNPKLSVLDLATGTGILAGAFAERGHRVEGLDFAENLLNRGKKKFPSVSFKKFDLYNLSEMTDSSYDIVSTGYFLHGLSTDFRKQILKDATRIAGKYVVVFDYCCKGNWFVRLIEWIEGPNYPGFITESRQKEFSDAGLNVERELRTSDFGSAWLCSKL
ncbi:MAG: class I SAM-dependent methyltransferase [Calditrichaceae bacterium]